jgi:phage terminase small subunit
VAKPLPAAPAWIDEDARLEWDRSLLSIKPRDVASVNLTEYEVYCVAFCRWQAAEKHLKESGTEVVIRNDKGEVKSIIASPQVLISQKAYEQMSKARNASGLQRARELAAG